MRDAKDCALVGEVVIVLVLRYRRHEQKGCKRCNHHADEDKNAAVTVHVTGQHLGTIAKVTVKVRPVASYPRISFVRSVNRLECAPKNPARCQPPEPSR